MIRAVAFLHSVCDIDDFAAKVSPGGSLRDTCLAELQRAFGLTAEEAKAALSTYLGRT